VLFCRNIDDVDKTMDEINDNMENMRQIQDLLSAPMGAAADFDEVSLLRTRSHSWACMCVCAFVHAERRKKNPNLFCFE
jgi:hypothetical protein